MYGIKSKQTSKQEIEQFFLRFVLPCSLSSKYSVFGSGMIVKQMEKQSQLICLGYVARLDPYLVL